MTQVMLIDRPDLKVSVRADIADQFMVCDACEGRQRWRCLYYDPSALKYGGLYSIHEPGAACCRCGGRAIIRKSLPNGDRRDG